MVCLVDVTIFGRADKYAPCLSTIDGVVAQVRRAYCTAQEQLALLVQACKTYPGERRIRMRHSRLYRPLPTAFPSPPVSQLLDKSS